MHNQQVSKEAESTLRRNGGSSGGGLERLLLAPPPTGVPSGKQMVIDLLDSLESQRCGEMSGQSTVLTPCQPYMPLLTYESTTSPYGTNLVLDFADSTIADSRIEEVDENESDGLEERQCLLEIDTPPNFGEEAEKEEQLIVVQEPSESQVVAGLSAQEAVEVPVVLETAEEHPEGSQPENAAQDTKDLITEGSTPPQPIESECTVILVETLADSIQKAADRLFDSIESQKSPELDKEQNCEMEQLLNIIPDSTSAANSERADETPSEQLIQPNEVQQAIPEDKLAETVEPVETTIGSAKSDELANVVEHADEGTDETDSTANRTVEIQAPAEPLSESVESKDVNSAAETISAEVADDPQTSLNKEEINELQQTETSEETTTSTSESVPVETTSEPAILLHGTRESNEMTEVSEDSAPAANEAAAVEMTSSNSSNITEDTGDKSESIPAVIIDQPPPIQTDEEVNEPVGIPEEKTDDATSIDSNEDTSEATTFVEELHDDTIEPVVDVSQLPTAEHATVYDSDFQSIQTEIPNEQVYGTTEIVESQNVIEADVKLEPDNPLVGTDETGIGSTMSEEPLREEIATILNDPEATKCHNTIVDGLGAIGTPVVDTNVTEDRNDPKTESETTSEALECLPDPSSSLEEANLASDVLECVGING